MQNTTTEERPSGSDPDRVPELLEQLIPHLRCDVCADPISPFEMLVIWPLASVTAHMSCYLKGQSIASVEASS